MKKYLVILSVLLSMMLFPGFTVYAEEVKMTSGIDPYIYEIVEDYENGTFSERNDLPEFDAHKALAPLNDTMGANVQNIFDNRQIGENTYVASCISFYDLDKTQQGEQEGVVTYVAIQYVTKTFGNPWDYVMLNKVKGGVVKKTGSVSCSSVSFKYKVSGDAYNADGSRVGYKGKSVNYNGELNNPIAGTTYYINGPQDYYYNMGAGGSVVAGFMRATLSSGSNFEVSIDISSI